MKKNNSNKNNILILSIFIVVIVTVLFTVVDYSKDSNIDVNQVISTPKRWFNNGVQSVSNLISTYGENKKLKKKVNKLDALEQQKKNQSEEIDYLKDEVELNKTLINYEKVTANVVERTPSTWQNVLVVDKGSNDGIKKNMPVMSQKGLIGRILEVNTHSSKIQLLTSDTKYSNHFPVKISSNNGISFGVLNKYEEKGQYLIASQITEKKDIQKGDIVQTSGLGGNSPADLAIGTVIKVKTDSYGIDQEVYIKPYAQMYDISVVTIIQGIINPTN